MSKAIAILCAVILPWAAASAQNLRAPCSHDHHPRIACSARPPNDPDHHKSSREQSAKNNERRKVRLDPRRSFRSSAVPSGTALAGWSKFYSASLDPK
jgi:hypothetical protein